ncbi:methyltransferase domain-containing protein [Streptomyces sp. RPT161]|uniref:methyltransferase domain-containing protein n=1 Tax=Streptomyces sp. RPT161 TaxID=3015993 RepID=UPI0022B881EB|nr:methyltransferase domain-containing protein [Streptomyces sp. RPT161]
MSTPQRLVEMLHNKGALPPEWRDAVASVDRGLFIPEVFGNVDKSTDPQRWRRIVYGDLPIVTQVNDGTQDWEGNALPTSSSSKPSIMLEMLDLLKVDANRSVLEIGTGTGYNAAWLCHRLGDERVTTVEYDEAVARQAIKNLAAAGFTPHVVIGDGLNGCRDQAPYSGGILAACTVREIPYAWVEQAEPGAKIVAPWGNSFFSGSFATLDVAKGTAQGAFSGNPAFMFARQHRDVHHAIEDVHHGEKGRTDSSDADPRELVQDDALFFASLHLPHASLVWCNADDGSDEATLWLLANDKRSWATIEYAPGQPAYGTEQFGPRNLWAHRRWKALGRPERSRFGLTVGAQGQQVWLDEPRNTIR